MLYYLSCKSFHLKLTSIEIQLFLKNAICNITVFVIQITRRDVWNKNSFKCNILKE